MVRQLVDAYALHAAMSEDNMYFGLGGIATDVIGDHASRLSPLTDTDAHELVRGWPMTCPKSLSLT